MSRRYSTQTVDLFDREDRPRHPSGTELEKLQERARELYDRSHGNCLGLDMQGALDVLRELKELKP